MNMRQINRVRRSVSDGTPFKQHKATLQHAREVAEDLDRLRQTMSDLARQHARWRERRLGLLSSLGEAPSRDVAMHHQGMRLLFATVLILVLEMGLAAMLAASWLNFSQWVAAGAGAVLALILAAAADVLMSLLHDPENPRTSYDRVKVCATWLTAICLALLTIICLTRFFPIGAQLFPWASGGLTILLPATAGSYLTLRSIIQAGNLIAREWSSLDGELRQTRILSQELSATAEELRQMLAKSGGGIPATERTQEAGSGPRAAAWLIFPILFFAMLFSSSSRVAAQHPSQRFEALELWVDISGSLDEKEARRVLDGIGQSASDLAQQGVRRIDLYTWASAKDTMRGPQASFELPPTPTVTCSPPQLSETEKVLKIAYQKKMQLSQEECMRRRRVAQVAYDRSLSNKLSPLKKALFELRLTSPAAQSCVHHALRRAATEPSRTLILLVTDGEHCRCGPAPAAASLGGVLGPTVVVVLVPEQKDEDDVQESMVRRARTLRSVLPEIRILLSYQVHGAKDWLARAVTAPSR